MPMKSFPFLRTFSQPIIVSTHAQLSGYSSSWCGYRKHGATNHHKNLNVHRLPNIRLVISSQLCNSNKFTIWSFLSDFQYHPLPNPNSKHDAAPASCASEAASTIPGHLAVHARSVIELSMQESIGSDRPFLLHSQTPCSPSLTTQTPAAHRHVDSKVF